MEALPPRLTLKAGLWQQAALGSALLLALLCAPGCTLDQVWTAKDGGPSAAGRPCELATAWVNAVQYTPDVAHDGKPTPGLVGRLYLFDSSEKYPLVGDGSVLITLYDDTHGPAQQPLEQWDIDPVALRKFLKKDVVGWGYTLFLPWGSCRPDVTKVHLTCKYQPAHGGTPLFGPASPLTLDYSPPPDGTMPAESPMLSPPPPGR
jgi:hypothetical protein